MKNIPNKIITHTAVSFKTHTAQDVDAWHKLRWPGFTSNTFKNEKGEPYHVGYHFVIEWDGRIVQCRDMQEEGAHCIGQNTSSIGVCFMGNGDVHYPSSEQKKAWIELYARISKAYPEINRDRIYPHRKYANKTCHGKLLSDDYYQLALGHVAQPSTKELMEKVVQLQNKLLVLLKGRRMR